MKTKKEKKYVEINQKQRADSSVRKQWSTFLFGTGMEFLDCKFRIHQVQALLPLN